MTASVLRRQRIRPPCPCGECRTVSGFCEAHAARLAGLRDQYAEDWKGRMGSVGNGGRAKAGPPRCCRLGCFNPREMGEHFCFDHADEGADE